jgi:hypothetical protein
MVIIGEGNFPTKYINMETKKLKVMLNRGGDNSPWEELERVGLVGTDRFGYRQGKRGLSYHPKWDGWYDSKKMICNNSSIELTEKGLDILRKSTLTGWEIKN